MDDYVRYPYGCVSGAGTLWQVDATLVFDGSQSANWIVRVEPTGRGDGVGVWRAVPPAATALHVEGAAMVGAPGEVACVVADAYDPAFAGPFPLGKSCTQLEHGHGCATPPRGPWTGTVAAVFLLGGRRRTR